MDWQKVIMDIVVVIFMALVTWGWKAYGKPFVEDYVKPWLIGHNLTQAAQIAVSAAQAIWGRYNGEEKMLEALKQLEAKGWNIESDSVVKAVLAAWQDLNLAQIAAGIKEPQEETVPEPESDNG